MDAKIRVVWGVVDVVPVRRRTARCIPTRRAEDVVQHEHIGAGARQRVEQTVISFFDSMPHISTPVKAPNFNGTLNVTQFTTQTVNGVAQLVAVGSLTGTMNGPNGSLQNVSIGNVVMPVSAIAANTCPLVALTLGPLHLNVLGLVVDLNQVVLNITAVGAPGNLLGNLLCGVAGLLDNPSGLAALLNQILTLL